MHHSTESKKYPLIFFLLIVALCTLLAGCNVNVSVPTGNGNTGSGSTTGTGSGVQSGVQVYVEPDAGEHIITNAIASAQKSVWLEMYLLTDRNVLRALEEAAHRSIDVRVMLEPHPYGGGSPTKTLDELSAAGIKAQATSPDFALTHEKGMIIDGSTAYIMTSNFTRSALGGTSGGSNGYRNREYGIIDTNAQDVQSVISIFNADWNHSGVQLNDANLVVSPINARDAFTNLINSAHSTLLIEAEEMQDSGIEQALTNAAKRGVHVQVILPAASSSSGDSNSDGINTIKQSAAQVKEDPQLYMHAKIMLVDGQRAFVGSENISTASLERNRELGIIVSDTGVLNTLQQTFQQDWSVSQSV